MNDLRVSLSSIPESGLAICTTVNEAAIKPPEAEGIHVTPITVEGILQNLNGEYLFKGTISGEYIHTCDRCLVEARQPFSLDVLWTFEEGAPYGPCREFDDEVEEAQDGPPASAGFEGGEIDLTTLVWEETSLGAPIKYLCREDCAGLCPGCGANLNEGPCGCGKTEENLGSKGLSRLAELFPDLEPDRRED